MICTEIDPIMMHDIQAIVGRLVAKAGQLIGNFTTNLAEGWMQVRSKFDGGKVINRSPSGSWEHRCHGAALQQNLGRSWGPPTWAKMTSSPATRFLLTRQTLLQSRLKIHENEKLQKQLKTDDDRVSTQKQMTQLQLAKHIVDMTMAFYLMSIPMTSLLNL